MPEMHLVGLEQAVTVMTPTPLAADMTAGTPAMRRPSLKSARPRASFAELQAIRHRGYRKSLAAPRFFASDLHSSIC